MFHLLIEPCLVHNDQSFLAMCVDRVEADQFQFTFDMTALLSQLKQMKEKHSSPFYNVQLLKYEVRDIRLWSHFTSNTHTHTHTHAHAHTHTHTHTHTVKQLFFECTVHKTEKRSRTMLVLSTCCSGMAQFNASNLL